MQIKEDIKNMIDNYDNSSKLSDEELKLIKKGYNSNSKFKDVFIEPSRTYDNNNRIKICRDIKNNKDKELLDVGKCVADEENKLIPNSLLKMRDKYDELDLDYKEIIPFITEKDPNEELIIFTDVKTFSYLNIEGLLKAKGGYMLNNRKIVYVPSWSTHKMLLILPSLVALDMKDEVYTLDSDMIEYFKYFDVYYIHKQKQENKFFVLNIKLEDWDEFQKRKNELKNIDNKGMKANETKNKKD